MSTRSCELEDQIADIDKELLNIGVQKSRLNAEISDIMFKLDRLEEEKEILEGKLYEEEEEPSLSVGERNGNL